MGRAPCCDKNGLKKGPWTPEEDHKLISYIQLHGPGNWRNLPKNAGLQRCGKSCRLRWTNYLRPDIKRGRFSFEEEETIIQLHSILGNKSTLCNSSLLNVSNLFGAQALLNPELLRLASTLLSLKQENPETVMQYLQQNQLCNIPQLQNQTPITSQVNDQFQTHIPEVSNCTTSNAICTSNFDQTQLMQANLEGLLSNLTNLSSQNFQENLIPSSLTETFVSEPNHMFCSSNPTIPVTSEGSSFQSLNNGNQNFSFDSVMSTPLSSPTPLNSSSTYINSSPEDERESYCSSLLKFEIPESLDISDFL
ncbi:hypothetical protein Patl1_02145 [Pistacia atlantica]|uniref:Uncharacterized protein n=1 Tax=Pistacia atlantica TaxID=434234 RepID=A0ACC1CCI8_9ROSI|nr:hypothetical protein Patl1_02145 [Pistacia atlantica]